MGQDFAALFPYDGPDLASLAIHVLEENSESVIGCMADRWIAAGFGLSLPRENIWTTLDGEEHRVPRPELPCLDIGLQTKEGALLIFGSDSVRLTHLLRWRIYLTAPSWQSCMASACRSLARLFGSREYIITRDEAPIMEAFLLGAAYGETGGPGHAGEPCVSSAHDMYREIDSDGTWGSEGFMRVSCA